MLDFMSEKLTLSRMQLTILCLLASAVFPSLSRAQAPVFEIEPAHSSIKFHVKASVNIAGKFDKWDASLKFTSPDETTGDFQVTIQAASVDTGSGNKNNKLKDLFAVEQNPVITFKSTKFVQTGPETFEVDGDFIPDLCTEFGLVGDCLLNFGRPRFCQIGFGTSTEDLPL